MLFYLDTARVEEIREAAGWGILAGVTTNPTLAARERRPFRQLLEEICSLVDGPVSAEVIGTDAPAMVQEARELSAVAPNVVVKVPMTVEGLKATRQLSREGIPVNMTLIFTPMQAMLAARAGASYVSPFVGRLDDIGHEGMHVVRDTVALFRQHGLPAQVIAASLRHPLHVLQAARAGAHIATMPFAVLKALVSHPLTERGLERFLADWAQAQQALQGVQAVQPVQVPRA